MVRKIGIVDHLDYYCLYKSECHCFKGNPLKDVLKDVKYRRASFNRWLNQSPPSQLQEALTVHKQVAKELY
jgi:hypothetical protein